MPCHPCVALFITENAPRDFAACSRLWTSTSGLESLVYNGDSHDTLYMSLELIMDSILFLCTGNYYRSRFAEEIFNHRAQANGWRADSRGLCQDMSPLQNVGPMSSHALGGLQKLGIVPMNPHRYPISVHQFDIEESAMVIAMSREEHYPLMKQQYPKFAKQVEYWEVADTGLLLPDLALSRIESLVDQLISHL